MGEKIEVRVTYRFRVPAERVYDAWLDPDKLRVWQSAALKKMGLSGEIGEVTIDAKVGGTFLYSDFRDGSEMCHRGTYLELDRPRRIVFTWIAHNRDEPDPAQEADPDKVTLTIEPDGDGCVATIVHHLNERWKEFLDPTRNGWSAILEATEAVLVD